MSRLIYKGVDKNLNYVKFYFSACDLVVVKGRQWYIDSMGYPTTYVNKKPTRFHKMLAIGKITDHINGDKLDNTRDNLRSVTKSQNSMNIGVRANNKSGFTGVYFRKDRLKWVSYININGKRKNLGSFRCPLMAILSRKEAEVKYFGEYRRI